MNDFSDIIVADVSNNLSYIRLARLLTHGWFSLVWMMFTEILQYIASSVQAVFSVVAENEPISLIAVIGSWATVVPWLLPTTFLAMLAFSISSLIWIVFILRAVYDTLRTMEDKRMEDAIRKKRSEQERWRAALLADLVTH